MSYTAIESMRKRNQERFGSDLGPMQPPFYQNEEHPDDLKSAALRFLRERCEELLFDPVRTREEMRDGLYLGRSLSPDQIPVNMERDINRLCLEKSLETFIDSGAAEDAYTVYYCYLVMFLGRYGSSKQMVELLSEFEANGSSVLMKHRDHYSHSVYVFALGLAIYETNEAYRRSFRAFYRLEDKKENEAANLFLEYWGLTSLFHDIGYPFELPFEQVLSYFEVEDRERGKGSLYLAYHDVEALTALDETAKVHFRTLYGRDFETVIQLLAFDLAQKLGAAYDFTAGYLLEALDRKPVRPDTFGYFMDHAFFSAARLYRELAEEEGAENLTRMHVDALSAIILHNSLFKFSICFYKSDSKRKAPLRIEQHPLAWLLMYCDELQCWDRTAYGRNSRTELHPMSVDFDFSGGAVRAKYYFDAQEIDKILEYKNRVKAWESGGRQGKAPKLKAYSSMAGDARDFTVDIERIVDTGDCPLTVEAGLRPVDRGAKRLYLSSSSFMHLYDFAVTLHGRNAPPDTSVRELEGKFDSLSLEYQLSGINRAKSFGRYLNALGCFYTDRPVDYDMVLAFTPADLEVIAPLEHERWIREHQTMGWRQGTEYETLSLEHPESRQALREQLRIHKLAMDGELTEEQIRAHYFSLPPEDQDKDWKPLNSMLMNLRKYDGLRIYRL